MPKSSKRRAAPAAVKPTTKRPRADVHPIQEALAGRVPDEPGIIVAPMGSGKPRMAGKFLDRIVPEHVAACGDEVPGVLTIVGVTDAKHGREQAAQYGVDFPGPYHCSDLDAVLRKLEGNDHAARIMIPFATFRKLVCYKKKGASWGIWDLLEKFGQPDVVFLFDEVTEVYKAANGKLPRAVDALRTKYAACTEATITVIGMSGTPELENALYAARAKTLFGAEPKVTSLTAEEGKELLEAINPQCKISTRDVKTVEELPTPTEPTEKLEDLATLVVGNALFNDIRGDAAVKKLTGEVLVQQVLGDDQDGGVLFQQLAPAGKAPMFKVGKEGVIGKTPCSVHEAVLITLDSTCGAQALYDNLEELKKRSGTDELRAFTVHDLRLQAQAKATKEADKVPHVTLKRDVADQKAALKAYLAAAAEQTGTTIAIIDKRQALSGTNDFAVNVQRAVAIGAWEPFELDQFYKRLGRACELKEGDLVPQVLYGVHLSSPFAANLVAPAKERVSDKALLTKEAKAALAKLKATAEKNEHLKAKDVAEVLAATGLSGDPALKYLECLDGAEAFKENEYMPLITHHKDCEGEEETDEATGKAKKTVTKCCDACKCVFVKGGEGDEDDEE
jgi:hypothetical protein